MEEIVRLIQQEAKKRKCSLFEVLEEIEEMVQDEHEKKFSEGIGKRKTEEHEVYDLCFIEEDMLENVWFAESMEQLIEDANGYVVLKPLLHYENLSVKKKDLVMITKDETAKLIQMMTWLSEDECEVDKEYQQYAKSLIDKK